MTVTLIMRHDTDSYNGRSSMAAIASDEAAAKRWIQDEVDGKHGPGWTYMQGKDADWWIEYGTFSLVPTIVNE